MWNLIELSFPHKKAQNKLINYFIDGIIFDFDFLVTNFTKNKSSKHRGQSRNATFAIGRPALE